MGINWENQASEAKADWRYGAGIEAAPADELLCTKAMLRAMLSGAQARGMSDALDLMGVGAILMDATGMVLQANATAEAVLGKSLFLANRHLVAKAANVTRALQAMIGLALEGMSSPDPVRIEAGQGETGWIAQARMLPRDISDSDQMLKLIVTLQRP